MPTSNLTIGDSIIINYFMLGVITGRNIHDETFLVKLVNYNNEDSRNIRVLASMCIPATKAAWVLYGRGPISDFFKIMSKGDLFE